MDVGPTANVGAKTRERDSALLDDHVDEIQWLMPHGCSTPSDLAAESIAQDSESILM